MASEWAAQVIGINYYPEYTTLKPLTAAAEDAEKIAQQLEQYGYRPFRAQCLPRTLNQKGESKIDRQGAVKVQELREAIANLFNPPDPNPSPETALFFFSGHGWCKTVAGKEEVFLATSDVLPEAEIYGISLSWLGEQLQKSQAKRVVVWLDCCYSGELLKFIPTDKDYCFITATRSYETGVEIPHTQGLLTQALLAGLNPENEADGIINSHKLENFIISQMPNTVQRPLIHNSLRAILLTTKFSQKSFQDKCPYRSLSYFSETKEDAEVFYGRSALTGQLIQQVTDKHRLIAVLGASGSGKSSLLRAGLFYQMKLGQDIPGSDRWTYITPFTPKESPVKSLQEAFSVSLPNLSLPETTSTPPPSPPRSRGGERLREQMRGGLGTVLQQSENRYIAHVIGERLKALNTPVILIIDQFEECFTMCDDNQRQGFFDCLRELIDCTDNLYIFIGMRSDFRGRWREYPEYASRIHKPYINVEHLNREEIEEAITKPADWVGLGIEGRLKQQLINDVEDYPGSLPLLQYTLTELWRESRNQGDEVLSLKTYEDLGGVEGTLQKRADAVYESLSLTEKTVARRIFLELTQIGETTDVRRRVRLRELVNSHHSLELLQQVSEKLADKDARLITKTDEADSQDVILDVVHEALIRHWQMLRNWKEEYKLGIGIERQIEAEAQEWERNDKKPGFLRKDDRLAVAEVYLTRFGDWQMLNGVAEEYIHESQELRNRLEREKEEHRKQEIKQARRIAFGAISAGLIMTGLAIFTGIKGREAQIGQINALSGTSEALLASNQNFDDLNAVINSLQAAKKLKQVFLLDARLRDQVRYTMQTVIYGVKERDRLEQDKGQMISGLSADGSKLANLEQYGFVCSWDNLVCLWDKSGEQIAKFLEPQHSLKSMTFSPDGSKFIIASEKVSPDGTISHDSSLTLRLWDLKSKKQLAEFKGRSRDVWSVSFSPDGNKIALAGDKGIRLWDLNGKQIPEFKGGQGRVTDVVFSPDGTKLASVNSTRYFNFDTKQLEGDVNVSLWDLKGKRVSQLKGNLSSVDNVIFAPDGKRLATTGEDGTVRLWDLSGNKVSEFKDTHGDVIFSPDGNLLAGSGKDDIPRVWDLSGNQLFEFKGHQGEASGVIFSPDGKQLVTKGRDKTIRLWNLNNKEFPQFKGQQEISFGGFSFSPDSSNFATAEEDGNARLWDLSGKKLAEFKGAHLEWRSSSVIFNPDGNQLAVTGEDGILRLWDINSRKLLKTESKKSQLRDRSFLLINKDEDGTVSLWNWQGKQLAKFKYLKGKIQSVSLSSNGNKLATVEQDDTVYLWDWEGKQLAQFKASGYSMMFSPDGKLLATTGNGTAQLWDLSGKQVAEFKAYPYGVVSISFSPDGKLLATAGLDGIVKLWDLESKLQVAEFNPERKGQVKDLAFSPNGKLLVIVSNNGIAKFWRFESLDELMVRGCDWVRNYLENNPKVEASDKHLCDGVGTKSN